MSRFDLTKRLEKLEEILNPFPEEFPPVFMIFYGENLDDLISQENEEREQRDSRLKPIVKGKGGYIAMYAPNSFRFEDSAEYGELEDMNPIWQYKQRNVVAYAKYEADVKSGVVERDKTRDEAYQEYEKERAIKTAKKKAITEEWEHKKRKQARNGVLVNTCSYKPTTK